MAATSNYLVATRQISLLSAKLANNVTFRNEFEAALTSAAGTRIAALRSVLRKNGITYRFRLYFTFGAQRVQIWAPVTNPETGQVTNVGFTYRIVS